MHLIFDKTHELAGLDLFLLPSAVRKEHLIAGKGKIFGSTRRYIRSLEASKFHFLFLTLDKLAVT